MHESKGHLYECVSALRGTEWVQVDVFSYGVLLWELATKDLPLNPKIQTLNP